MSFTSDISKFAGLTIEATDKVYRGSALEIFGSVVLRTPVDTGRLMGNWQASLNTPESSSTIDVDKTGSRTINKISAAVSKATTRDDIFMVNNLVYARVIEEGGKNRVPVGMIRLTLIEWNRAVAKQAEENKV